jgi:hypothetical protein
MWRDWLLCNHLRHTNAGVAVEDGGHPAMGGSEQVERPGVVPGPAIVVAALTVMALAAIASLPLLDLAAASVLTAVVIVGFVPIGIWWSRRRGVVDVTPLWRRPPSASFHLSLVAPTAGVAPVAGALVWGALAVDAPLRARWLASRPAFEAAVESAGADDGRIGLFSIRHVRRDGEAVIFTEANGAFFDDAGFAYLPDGPHPGLENGSFESPQYTHLGGPWYSWAAGW